MVHKKEKGTYHCIEKLMKEMPVFLSPRKGVPFLLVPEYSGINKDQRIPDRSKTAHRKSPVKYFLTISHFLNDFVLKYLAISLEPLIFLMPTYSFEDIIKS